MCSIIYKRELKDNILSAECLNIIFKKDEIIGTVF